MSHSTAAAPSPGAKVVPTPYEIDWVRAAVAGFVAQLATLPFLYALYFAYREDSMDLPLVFGSFLAADPIIARILGIGAMFGIGIATALAYAVVCLIFRWQSNGGKGTVFGFLVFVPTFAFVLPWTIGFLARLAPTHIVMNNPDVMFNQVGHGNVGWEPAAYAACAYLLYGLIVGGIYRHKIRDMGTRYRLEYQGG